MFTVRIPAWHDRGGKYTIGEYPGSWAEARKLAGLDWEPTEEPVFELVGVTEAGADIYQPIPGWRRIARSDTRATLAVPRDSYTLINHTQMGEIVEAVLAQTGIKWETAGVLAGGRKVWTLVRLDEPIQLPGDNSMTMPYLAITNHHDGTGACTLRATAVRIVCANTFAAAELEGDRHGATFTFRHTKNWRDRISEAATAVTGARAELDRYYQLAEHLLGVPVNANQRELFVRRFIPAPPEAMASDRVMGNIEQARAAVRAILASSTTAAVADTGYGLVQAAGEYLDHVRVARSWETKLGRTLLRPEPGKARAMRLVTEVTRSQLAHADLASIR
jgi:phage/plasmid-like protein (TIGR03299 family)